MSSLTENEGPNSSTSMATSPRLPVKKGRKPYTGCLNCKNRKIKCDKTRPYCLRCLRSARECDGYPVPYPSVLNRFRISPFPDFDSQEEARVFDFYLNRSSVALSCALDQELWNKVVVQLSMTEPAIRHAALAVSSLHRRSNLTYREDRQRKLRLDADDRFALSQYNKAIKALRLWKPPAADDNTKAITPLITCLLFVTIEFLRNDQGSSQRHICQGRKMIAELDAWNLGPSLLAFLKKYVVPVYQRLGLPCYLFGTVPVPIPSHLRQYAGEIAGATFTSIDHARDVFYDLLDEALYYVNIAQYAAYSIPHSEKTDSQGNRVDDVGNLQEKAKQLLLRLDRWNVAFTALAVTLPSVALPTLTRSLLMLYYHAAKTWLLTALIPSEVIFDQHLEAFSAIITASAALIDNFGSKRQPSYTEQSFTFETQVIGPLYWTCFKCRHPVLRRAALKLLQRDEMKTRRENLWSAEAIAAVLKLIIVTEENGQRGDDSHFKRTVLSRSDQSILEQLLRVPAYSPPAIHADTHREILKMLSGNGARNIDLMAPSMSLPADDPKMPDEVRSTLTALYVDSKSRIPPPSPAGPDTISTSVLTTVASSQLLLHDYEGEQSQTMESSQGLVAPFGIPNSDRIKNVILGPWEDEGLWVTIFRDPLAGRTDWDVKRTFLHI